MKKPTTQQCAEYFILLDKIDNDHFRRVDALQETMRKHIGNKKLEFFWQDGRVVGIGTKDRKLKLIHRE